MKTTANTTKNSTKTSANKHNVSRETLTKNNMKVEGKTMNKKNTKTTKSVAEIIAEIKNMPKYDGTNFKEISKGAKIRKRTNEDLKRQRESVARDRGGKLANVDIKAVEGATDFDKLVTLITTYYIDIATATKKAVRFKFLDGKIVCWRRVNNIRVYTDNTELLPLEWVEDTHEIGYTHSAYTSYLTLAKLITANATPVIKA